MTYQTNDQQTIRGDTPAAVVDDLRAHAWMVETTVEDYRQAVATRVKLWNGADIRHQNASVFLQDLVSCGLLTRQ